MDFFRIKGNRKLSLKYWAYSITPHDFKKERIEGVPSEPSQKKKTKMQISKLTNYWMY